MSLDSSNFFLWMEATAQVKDPQATPSFFKQAYLTQCALELKDDMTTIQEQCEASYHNWAVSYITTTMATESSTNIAPSSSSLPTSTSSPPTSTSSPSSSTPHDRSSILSAAALLQALSPSSSVPKKSRIHIGQKVSRITDSFWAQHEFIVVDIMKDGMVHVRFLPCKYHTRFNNLIYVEHITDLIPYEDLSWKICLDPICKQFPQASVEAILAAIHGIQCEFSYIPITRQARCRTCRKTMDGQDFFLLSDHVHKEDKTYLPFLMCLCHN